MTASFTRRLSAPTPADGTTFLTVYLVLVLVIPSRLVVGPLGSAGAPATILGMVATVWWCWHQMSQRRTFELRTQPVRRTMLIFGGAIVASFVAAQLRPISDAESSSADSGLLLILAFTGLLLVANDGIPNRDRLDVLVRRIALGVGLVAVLGLVQFATGQPFTDLLQIPGLQVNGNLVSVNERSGFVRPAGTAIHPIEFGTVLNLLLPLCLYVAAYPGPIGRFRRWFPVVAIALAVPISISRSAIVGAAIVLAFLIPTWSSRVRRLALVGIVVLAGLMFVAVPGMLGTITDLFSGISGDTSTQSRTGSYDLAYDFIARAPIVGRGFLTFMPQYRILDNQYLGLAIDTGLLGVFSLLALFVVGLVVALRTRFRSSDPATRSLAQSFAASIAVAMASFALFDAFSFPMFAGLTFMVLGLAGCLWRLERALDDAGSRSPDDGTGRPPRGDPLHEPGYGVR